MKNKKETAYDLVIPGAIRNDSRLSRSEWIFYAEIRGLCRRTGSCYASNAYLGEIMDVDNRTIQRWIIHLEKCGHISVEHGSDENKNHRNITLTEAQKRGGKGATEMSHPMTGMSYPATSMSGGMTKMSPEGMTKMSPGTGGIRKNINITTTTTSVCAEASTRQDRGKKADDGDAFKNIPKSIASRFSVLVQLSVFARHCGGDIALMQRYLDYADGQKVRNPVGLAVTMARERRTAGPPDPAAAKKCAYCGDPGTKTKTHKGVRVRFCDGHWKRFQELIDAGKKEKANEVLDKGLAGTTIYHEETKKHEGRN